jgi:hypothetical protein
LIGFFDDFRFVVIDFFFEFGVFFFATAFRFLPGFFGLFDCCFFVAILFFDISVFSL